MYLRVLLLTSAVSFLRPHSTTVVATMALKASDFEVFGRVQGVFFRKYTKEQADKLGLRGWCKNTVQGTVLGHVQGPPDKVESMMCGEEEETMEHLMCECHALARQRMKDFGTGYPDPEEFKALPLSSIIQHMEMVEKALEMHWLKTVGSPSSQIDKAEFRNSKEIEEYTFDNFTIKKD